MAQETDVEISLPDGSTEAVLYQPSAGGKWPGVLYLTDIGGIRPAQRQAAQRLSDEGYIVLMPNVFYRVAKLPVINAAELRTHPELFMKRVGELAQPLTPEAIESDAGAYIDYLAGLDSVRDKSKFGVVGFCFCGAVAMRTAALRPNEIRACASFHGGGLYADKPTSPHLLLPRIQARLLFGHAEQDRSMPAEAIQGFEEELRTWGGQYESETYDGALHGWTTVDHPAYHPEQATKAFEKLKRLFSETLV